MRKKINDTKHLGNTGIIFRADRQRQNGHRAACLWFTGLPASGKSSIAGTTENMLYKRGIRTYLLDGDHIRQGLNRDLGFSREDRAENIRRIGEVSRLFVDAGIMVLTAFISPYRNDRDLARDIFDPGDFIEIYVEADIKTCEHRDPKGLYQKARRGEIKDFTGISAPYEPPQNPELILNTTHTTDVKKHAITVVKYLENKGYLIEKDQRPVSGTY